MSRLLALAMLGLLPGYFTLTSYGQTTSGQKSAEAAPVKRRSLSELLDTKDPAWPLVLDWVHAAKNHVEVLAPDQKARARVLVELQVTTHSTLGAVSYETGGILVDKGWLRILGSGSGKLPRTITDWNFGRTYSRSGEQPKYLLIGDDVVGGFFAVNGGALGPDTGNVYYLAPDTLKWESLGRGYSDFLHWCFAGDLAKFYERQRWKGWEADVARVGGSKAFSFYPPLYTAGPEISRRSRRAIPISEVFGLASGAQ